MSDTKIANWEFYINAYKTYWLNLKKNELIVLAILVAIKVCWLVCFHSMGLRILLNSLASCTTSLPTRMKVLSTASVDSSSRNTLSDALQDGIGSRAQLGTMVESRGSQARRLGFEFGLAIH